MVDILVVNQPPLTKSIAVPREIDCANPQKDYFMQPMGLAYIAGMARRYVSTKIIDANVLKKDYGWIGEQIKKEKPKLVIGGFTPPTLKLDLKLGQVTKSTSNALFGIWGPVPTMIHKRLFKEFPTLDFIISNEPEFTIEEIAKNMRDNKHPFEGVKGVVYRDKNKIINNGLRLIEKKLDDLAFPAYDQLPMEKYYVPFNRRLPMAFIRTSRGCPFSCIFCMVGGQLDARSGYGHRWRAYSPERALKEIEWLVKDLGVKEIVFFDPEFTIDKERVIEICKGMIKKKLDVIWSCQARVDQVREDMLKWMKKAGCYGISFGLETSDPCVMSVIKKKVSKEIAEHAIKITTQTGIKCGINFMIGLPKQTEESFLKDMEFAKYLARKYGARPQCTIATPYPGTLFRKMAEENNWIKGDIDELEQTSPVIEYPYLSREKIEGLHKKFYKEIVLDPIRLIKRVLSIRYIHEFKNLWLYIKHFTANLLGKMRYVR